MKEPWEWEEEDIEALIENGVQESLTLDYKRSASLDKRNPKSRIELSKDVAAFANSAGGVLIYGVEEDNHLPKQIDKGCDPQDTTREWIEQIINSTIQRRIDGIRIKQIVLTKKSPGQVLYIVSVPQSKGAPHMAVDHVFYKRFNYESAPMEEYEIRDVSNRNSTPDLHIETKLSGVDIDGISMDLSVFNNNFFNPIHASFIISNRSIKQADYIVINIFVDTHIETSMQPNDLFMYDNGTHTIKADDNFFGVKTIGGNWSIPAKMPVWYGAKFHLLTLNLSVPNKPGSYLFGWQLKSPGMEEKMVMYILDIHHQIVSARKI
jgi:hypothetical protein